MKDILSKWLRIFNARKIEFVDLKYLDLAGGLHHITYPVDRFPVSVEKGVGFDGSSLSGFRSVEAGDMVLKPDLETGFLDPVFERPTFSFYADIYDPKAGGPFSRDPRRIARRAQTLLIRELKLTRAFFLAEFEFYLLDRAFSATDKAGLLEPDEKSHYHCAPPEDRAADFRSDLMSWIAGCGIKVKYHHHEVGPAQQEVEIELAPLSATADAVTTVTYLVKNLARRAGTRATFMPLPVPGLPGSGLHIHQYFRKGHESFFGDRRAADLLSRAGRHYIGGIIRHARSLSAFTNPSPNSYKRLSQGMEAPNFAFYARANRTTAIRIPGYLAAARDMRIEYRPPDATANPGLALAAMVLAGLDGVRNRIEPGEPVEADVRSLPSAETKRLVKLPASLDEALDALAADNDWLKADGIFDDVFIKVWVALKKKEIANTNVAANDPVGR